MHKASILKNRKSTIGNHVIHYMMTVVTVVWRDAFKSWQYGGTRYHHNQVYNWRQW